MNKTSLASAGTLCLAAGFSGLAGTPWAGAVLIGVVLLLVAFVLWMDGI